MALNMYQIFSSLLVYCFPYLSHISCLQDIYWMCQLGKPKENLFRLQICVYTTFFYFFSIQSRIWSIFFTVYLSHVHVEVDVQIAVELRLSSQIFSNFLTVLLDFISLVLLFTASASWNSVRAVTQIKVFPSALHLQWQIALQWSIFPDTA